MNTKLNTIPEPRIDLSLATDIKCEKCNNDTFINGVKVKRLSAIATGYPKDVIVPIQIFICCKCYHVNSEFLPREIANEPQS